MAGALKRLLLLFGLIFCAASAHAANCPLAPGSAITTSVATSCGSGNTVTLSAGNYTLAPNTTWPCGVSLVGPTPAGNGGTQPFYSQTPNQTAKITTTNGYENYGFVFTANCSVPQTFQYLEWNGNRPTNGTVFISTNNESPSAAYAGNLNPQCFSGQCGCLLQHSQNNQGWNGNNSNGVPATATSGGGYVSCGNGGGNFARLPAGTKNVSFLNNYVHGANCGFLCGDRHASLIYLDSPGGQSTPGGNNPTFPGGYGTTDNITIKWNQFGTAGDCAQANTWAYNQNTEGGGGTCNGVSAQSGSTNLIVENNKFTAEDDELKFYELATNSGPPATGSAGYCNNCFFNFNHFEQFDRIALEMQINWGGPNEPTLEFTQYNDFANHLNPMQQDYDISQADGCILGFNSPDEIFCVNHVDYNFTVADGGPVSGINVGYEYWAGSGSTSGSRTSTGNGNVWVGNKAAISFQWDPSGLYTFNNNTVMTPQNNGNAGGWGCVLQNGQSNPSFGSTNPRAPYIAPNCSGNYSQTSNGTITSVQPSLSVSGGTITITNNNVSSPNGSAAPTGRDSNTTFWCTSNGNTPSIGNTANNGTSAYWAGTTSQTVANVTPGGSGTFKCIGMWGAPNQPYSYLAVGSGGGGYIPSAMASIAFSGGGPSTVVTPAFTPAAPGSYWPTQSVSVATSTPGASIFCTTNGTTPTSASPPYTGAFNLTSSPASTTIKCMATASGFVDSAVASGTYTATPPTLTSCYQGNTTPFTNTLAVGGTVQQHIMCQYTGLPDQQCSPGPDTNLSSVTSWGLTGGASVTIGAVGSGDPGFVTAVSTGSATLTTATASQNGGAPITCGEWGWTVTNSPPTLTGVSISLQSGGSGVTIGTPQQACATFIYTGSISDTICGNSADAFGSTANTWTSSSGTASMSSSGVVTGNSAGTAQITVKATNGSTTVGPSTPQTITINTPVTGSNYILSGPQHLSGQVIQ